ncbi:MAG: hypothetical protein ACI4OZ_10120 [Akkermansia sp.]
MSTGMVELMAAPVRGELVVALRGAEGRGWELRFRAKGKGRSFRADERGLDAVRDVLPYVLTGLLTPEPADEEEAQRAVEAICRQFK